jgi:hypothetical protein
MSRLLLAETNQRLYRISQEVPPMLDLLLEDEVTSRSYVSCQRSSSLHQVGNLLHYLQPPFSKGAPLHHCSYRILHEVGRSYANV